MVKVGKYNYEKSNRKNKKLMVKVGNKIIHFGDSRMQQFKDKTGIYKKLDHGDEKRKKNYLSRARGIKDKSGNLTYKNPLSPNYHSIKILWDG